MVTLLAEYGIALRAGSIALSRYWQEIRRNRHTARASFAIIQRVMWMRW